MKTVLSAINKKKLISEVITGSSFLVHLLVHVQIRVDEGRFLGQLFQVLLFHLLVFDQMVSQALQVLDTNAVQMVLFQFLLDELALRTSHGFVGQIVAIACGVAVDGRRRRLQGTVH